MSSTPEIVRDENNNIIAVKGLSVGETESYDVTLDYAPRTFAEIWQGFPEPDSPPAFWGDANGARAARDALVAVLQAEHVAGQATTRAALVGGGRFAFVVPIGATADGSLQSTLGYYRHYNNWLWSRGRGVDTVPVDAGCGAGGFYKAVYARFEAPSPPVRITEISEIRRHVFTAGGVETLSDECALIRNEGAAGVDISGWSLDAGDRGQQLVFPQGTVIGAGNSITVWTHRGDTDPEDSHFSFERKSSVWNNKGDIGRLLDAEGELISEVAYGSEA